MSITVNKPFTSYYSLFQQDHNRIRSQASVEPSIRNQYENLDRCLREEQDKTITALTYWKENKQSATVSVLQTIQADPLITQKADNIRLAIKIAHKAATIFALIAVIAWGCTLGASFIVFLELLTRIAPWAAADPSLALPVLYISFITMIVSAGAYIISRITESLLPCSKILRQDRLHTNKNFQEFSNIYLENKLNFNPTYEDLLDNELYSIYSQWESSMQKFADNVKNLHCQLEFEQALAGAAILLTVES